MREGVRPTIYSNSVESWLHCSLRISGCVLVLAALLGLVQPLSEAQDDNLSSRIAESLVHRTPQGQFPKWDEEVGRQLQALNAQWYNTSRGAYFRYVERTLDAYINVPSQLAGDWNGNPEAADLLGRQLLLLHRVTLDRRYYDAARTLRDQLALSCGLSQVSPPAGRDAQLSRSCLAEPFLAEYASLFGGPGDLSRLAKDLLQTGNLYHAQSDVESQVYLAAALVDSIAFYPQGNPGRPELVALLNRLVAQIGNGQDTAAAQRSISASTVCLSVYAILKGVRLGYLPPRNSLWAEKMWSQVQKGAETQPTGELLLAATEMDLSSTANLGRGQTILVDAWYNSQQRRNAAGRMEYFHYKWSDFSDSGYSLLGHLFRSYGAETATLYTAPTKDTLRHAGFYLIASPDIPVKNPNPHYMTDRDAAEIASWVHGGGVLILMENDPPNADIDHLNRLADHFGIHFNNVLRHHILGEQVADGAIPVAPGGPVFHHAHTLYMKDTCSISLRGTATTLIRDHGDVVMATARYGHGSVYAVVDPWLYNEYTDGRGDPQIYGQFDNFAAGRELVQWLLNQRPQHSGTRKKADQ